MVMLNAFLALAAGFVLIAGLVALIELALKKLTPGWEGADDRPPAAYRFVNLGASFLAAAAGGYVTALVAGSNPLIHVLVLGIVVLALGALSALQSHGSQAKSAEVPKPAGRAPVSYTLALVALRPLGVLAGGILRLRVLGIL